MYFDMNDSIVYWAWCLKPNIIYIYVSWFLAWDIKSIIKFFKVTHIYYYINFRYWGLSWFLRHVNVVCLFCFEKLINVYVWKIIIFFWPGVVLSMGYHPCFVLDNSWRAWSHWRELIVLWCYDSMLSYCFH